jgi:hypothetical protein
MRAQLDASQYPSPPASHPDQKTPWTMPSGEYLLQHDKNIQSNNLPDRHL